MRTIEHWIDGSPRVGESSRRATVWNPATGQAQAEVVLGTPADVGAAVQAASSAFESWSESSLSTRT